MKPRIEKKLSKKIHAILGNMLGDVWIDDEWLLHRRHFRCPDDPPLTGKQERQNREQRVSVNHMPSIGGGQDYWGEGSDWFSVLWFAQEALMWHFGEKTDIDGPHHGYPLLKARMTGAWVIKHAKIYAMQERADSIKRARDKAITEELEESGVIEWKAGSGWVAKCVVCEEKTPLYCDPVDFDRHYHYCGGSPRCCL